MTKCDRAVYRNGVLHPLRRTSPTRWACRSCTKPCLWAPRPGTGSSSSWPPSWAPMTPWGTPAGAWTPSRTSCSSSSDPPLPEQRSRNYRGLPPPSPSSLWNDCLFEAEEEEEEEEGWGNSGRGITDEDAKRGSASSSSSSPSAHLTVEEEVHCEEEVWLIKFTSCQWIRHVDYSYKCKCVTFCGSISRFRRVLCSPKSSFARRQRGEVE